MTSPTLYLGEALRRSFSQALYRCLEEVGSTKAAFYLRDPETGRFHRMADYGWPRQVMAPDLLEADHPVVVALGRERRGLVVNQLEAFPELAAFAGGAEAPRFLLHPVFERGAWLGLLIQRDRMRGGSFELGRDEPTALAICQALAEVWRQASSAPPAPPVQEEALPVALPPASALSSGLPGISGAQEQLEGFQHIPGEDTGFRPLSQDQAYTSRNLDETGGGAPEPAPARRLRTGAFLPEQRTYFWEAARLLTDLVPMAAVALWMEEPLETRPVLAYSRQPLSPDLKQQVLAHVTYHVSSVVQRDLRILTRVEEMDQEPLAGIFQAYLPVLLVGDGESHDLMMLFRMEDRPFTEAEQGRIQRVARLLGLHLQEVRLHERYHRAFLSVSLRLLGSPDGGAPKLRDHSLATARLCRSFGMHLELAAPDLEALCLAAILHDVGTFLLDPRLLSKPGLTPEEFDRIRAHPVLATTFLKDLRFPFDVLGIIRHHHERWDGRGYPDGLRGEAIPLASRVICLVEAFEVMSHGSAFQPPKAFREILDELRREAGGQFDPTLVAEFVEYLQARRREGGEGG